ncbi:hypothetical protein RRG08_045027 [Elysia crispata]|uniref:Uncharacterized protein n=1 Tax=Elysia crispata TaxID=231223 RepID=A0AAE0Y3X1_9GAST|nr:hypothetical protein RRG08_045027 [Elysia crispata]
MEGKAKKKGKQRRRGSKEEGEAKKKGKQRRSAQNLKQVDNLRAGRPKICLVVLFALGNLLLDCVSQVGLREFSTREDWVMHPFLCRAIFPGNSDISGLFKRSKRSTNRNFVSLQYPPDMARELTLWILLVDFPKERLKKITEI